MNVDEDNIPFIDNYCDRWCERCEFTDRCAVFAADAEAVNTGDPVGDAVRTVAAALADAQRMLIEHAAELGIDLEAEANDPELVAGIERRHAAVKSANAVKLANEYADEARKLLEANGERLSDIEDPMTSEMIEILEWYVFFIAAKVHRGYHGLIDLDGDEETDQLEDTQSDANGSIKIALIAIERSILAWTYLINADNSGVIRPLIDRLEDIKRIVEAKFTHARDFIRPGFDEIEMVM